MIGFPETVVIVIGLFCLVYVLGSLVKGPQTADKPKGRKAKQDQIGTVDEFGLVHVGKRTLTIAQAKREKVQILGIYSEPKKTAKRQPWKA